MSRLTLSSPLSGWSAPLDEAPDAVFSQRMLGDGVLIDTTGNELRAPCDGEVISIAASRHAIAVRANNGAEILMHVGIDTVALAGEGFELHVATGAKVRTCDRLLTFDLDLLARKATSLVTPVIVTNGDRFEIIAAHTDLEVAAGDVLIELGAIAGAEATQTTAASDRVSETIRVEHEHGIHARPAALIASYAKGLAFDLEVIANGRSANPRSAVALMSLGIRGGDDIVVAASGASAAAAIA